MIKGILIGLILLVGQPVLGQTGIASWYGPKFHGHKMANGRKFDMNVVSVAHKHLKLGTKLLISYKNRTILAEVTDRGPYRGNRVLDLSREAARRLRIIRQGLAQVEYSVVNQ